MARLEETIAKALLLPEERITDDLAYNSIPEWDSVAHMALVAELEDSYEVMLETDDIVDMSSVAKIRTILGKYGVSA
jgi:acyl carrier protein